MALTDNGSSVFPQPKKPRSWKKRSQRQVSQSAPGQSSASVCLRDLLYVLAGTAAQVLVALAGQETAICNLLHSGTISCVSMQRFKKMQ